VTTIVTTTSKNATVTNFMMRMMVGIGGTVLENAIVLIEIGMGIGIVRLVNWY
jgi:hypothetical protein